MAKPQIWEVKVSDGVREYFVTEAEADFFYRDTAKAGFGVRKQPIPVPQTPKAFCMFMEEHFAEHRELLLAAHRVNEDRQHTVHVGNSDDTL